MNAWMEALVGRMALQMSKAFFPGCASLGEKRIFGDTVGSVEAEESRGKIVVRIIYHARPEEI